MWRNALVILAVVAFAAIVGNAQPYLLGKYEFVEDGGLSVGGSRILVVHRLELFEGKSGIEASLRADGFQTSRSLIASVEVVENRILVRFLKKGDGDVGSSLPEGALLMELIFEEGIIDPVTLFAAYRPALERPDKGRYFVRKPTRKCPG